MTLTWTLWLTGWMGLCIGSFLNVVIHRLPQALQDDPPQQPLGLVHPRSHCPQCHTPLRAVHLVPVLSWLWLRRRCAFCGHAISPRYPLIEIGTALLWLACAWRWGVTTEGLAWALCGSTLLALAVIDWETTWLPDRLTLPLLWAGLLWSAHDGAHLAPAQAIWGAALGYLSLWAVAGLFERLTGKVGMGGGDFKLLAALGAWLGPWALLPLVLLASLSGTLVGLVMQHRQTLRPGGYLPFGPFLAAAGMALAFAGDEATRWLFVSP